VIKNGSGTKDSVDFVGEMIGLLDTRKSDTVFGKIGQSFLKIYKVFFRNFWGFGINGHGFWHNKTGVLA